MAMMNKIERGIHDAQIRIKNLEREKLIIESKIQGIMEIINALEEIESCTGIPHQVVDTSNAMHIDGIIGGK